MKKIILTAFVACTVGLAFAESGTYEGLSSGTTSVTTNDFGNNKYSISNAIYTGGFKHEVQHGITIDETPLQAS